MPNIVILGSCRHEPYKVLAMPNKLDPELYKKDHEAAYMEAFEKLFRPAIDDADVVFVYAPGGIGDHTQRDIWYARKRGKPVVVFTGSDDAMVGLPSRSDGSDISWLKANLERKVCDAFRCDQLALDDLAYYHVSDEDILDPSTLENTLRGLFPEGHVSLNICLDDVLGILLG